MKAALFVCSLLVNLMLVSSAFCLVAAGVGDNAFSFWLSFAFAHVTAFNVGKHWADSAEHDCTMARYEVMFSNYTDPSTALPSDP